MSNHKEFGDLTVKYTPMIVNVAQKLHRAFGRKHDLQDLISEGVLAALQAERTYDPKRGEFSTYIRLRTRGAILSSITNTSSKHQRVLDKVHRYLDTYSIENGAIPSITMALKALGISKSSYNTALAASEARDRLSLDAVNQSDVSIDDSEDLEDAIEHLPVREKVAIQNMLADKRYNQKVYECAVKKLKGIMEVESE